MLGGAFAGMFLPGRWCIGFSSGERRLMMKPLRPLTRRTIPVASSWAQMPRLYWWAEGISREPATMRTYRLTTRNRQAARSSLERILRWDFDGILVGHGEPIHAGGRAALERAMAWLAG